MTSTSMSLPCSGNGDHYRSMHTQRKHPERTSLSHSKKIPESLSDTLSVTVPSAGDGDVDSSSLTRNLQAIQYNRTHARLRMLYAASLNKFNNVHICLVKIICLHQRKSDPLTFPEAIEPSA
jgi:hypothetical protein